MKGVTQADSVKSGWNYTAPRRLRRAGKPRALSRARIAVVGGLTGPFHGAEIARSKPGLAALRDAALASISSGERTMKMRSLACAASASAPSPRRLPRASIPPTRRRRGVPGRAHRPDLRIARRPNAASDHRLHPGRPRQPQRVRLQPGAWRAVLRGWRCRHQHAGASPARRNHRGNAHSGTTVLGPVDFDFTTKFGSATSSRCSSRSRSAAWASG